MKDVAKLGDFQLHSIGGPKWFQYGLPTVEDEMSMCRSLYTNEVVKLNIQVDQKNEFHNINQFYSLYKTITQLTTFSITD